MIPLIWVDSRVGSKELLPALRRAGVRAELAKLDSGDFVFEGRGPEGPVSVAIERKTIPDLVDSLQSGRLQGNDERAQLHRLRAAYDFVWLLVEGLWETDKHGQLVRRSLHGTKPLKGCHMTGDGLTKALVSLEVKGGLRVRQTASQAQSVAFLVALLRWWTEKAWDGHSTLLTPYAGHTAGHLSIFREMVMKLPTVGVSASKAIELKFNSSLARLLQSTVSDWASLELVTAQGPRRLGEAKAQKIIEALATLK